MIKRVPTNECVIEVAPRSAGDYGFIRIGGVERTPEEEYRFCEEIKKQIERHVDGVGSVSIAQTYRFEGDNTDSFDTLYEALETLYAEETVMNYRIRYRRKNDDCGTVTWVHSFQDLIIEAYRNPCEFEVKDAIPPLTDAQEKFLHNVLVAANAKE